MNKTYPDSPPKVIVGYSPVKQVGFFSWIMNRGTKVIKRTKLIYICKI